VSWRGPLLVSLVALLAGLGTGAPTGAWANPTGGTVAAGTATISSAGKTLTVNQTSNRAVINWQGFSIGAGETTRLNLPSSLSAILNRVTGTDPSLIAGHLSSNGQVYLINPNGIVVGPHGRIDTAGFVASTLNVPNDAFMAGGGLTFKGDSGAGIQVLGSIKASNGDVVLIAAMVDNQGNIAAPNGQAILGAGGEVFYIPDGQSDIVIKAPPTNGAASVSNSGTIAAASVQMKAAGSAYALAVNNSGLVSATGVSTRGGRIVLDGGDGDVVHTGTMTAAGGAATINGGQVTVSGTVDVSAPRGGGSIAVTAKKTATVAKSAALKASATTIGNGGRITVKAQGKADVEGSLEAKGGPQGGDGGSAEVSAPEVAFTGTVDTMAPQGKTGSFLLDPADVDICLVTCSNTPLSVLTVDIALLTSNFTVTATNSISVDFPISSTGTNTLTLDAPNTMLNAAISLPNGTLEFANSTATTNGAVNGAGAAITASRVLVDGSYASVNLSNAGNTASTLSFLGGATVSGGFAFSTLGALDVSAGTLTAGAVTILSAGNLSVEANTLIDSSGTKTLGSVGGTFINNGGSGIFTGAGRNRIYAATDVGLTQGTVLGGFLNYPQFNPVSIGSDPLSNVANIVYVAQSSLLPPMTVTANDQTTAYGVPVAGYTASFIGGTSANLASPVQFQIVGGPAVNAGTYTLQPFGAVSSTRALSFANGTLTVHPTLLTVTANNVTRLQGAGAPAFSASYSGLINGDNTNNILVFFTSQGFSTSPPGTYSIQPFGFSQNPNYTLQFVPGTLTIVKAPPPSLNPFTTLTVTYTPGTLNPTTTTPTVTTTGTPTTLTQEEVNPTQAQITVKVTVGTPLEIFGPLAEKLLDEFAATFDPPANDATILLALQSPEIAPTIMSMLNNFLLNQLDDILNKPQPWTADETAFVNGFLSYINAQRAAAANKAMADYEAWAKATVAAEDAKIKRDTGQEQLMEMAALSANPPIPPGDFLAEASLGMVLTGAQADLVLAQKSAGYEVAEYLNGTASAGYLAYINGTGFELGGKGLKIATSVTKITEGEEEGVSLQGTWRAYRAMTSEQKKQWQLDNPDEWSQLKQSMKTTSTGTQTATETTETTTETTKVTQTTTKILTAADTLEAVGRVAAVAGVVGEVGAILLQTAATATEYAVAQAYNDAFTASVNKAMTPIGVDQLKAMMKTGEAMTYLEALMAGGNPDAIDTSFKAVKPDMPLNQIVNITKNL